MSHLPEPARRHGRQKGITLLLAGLSTVGPFSIDTYLPSFPEMAEKLGASPLEVQQTLTAYLIPFTLMTLWHGAVSDALGRRSVVLVSLVMFAMASAGAALAPSIQVLWLFRALQGLTAGAGMVVARAVVRDVFTGEEAQRVLSRVSLLFALAPAVAPVIGGVIHEMLGWRYVFVFMGLIGLALAAWSWYALPETLPPEERTPLHPRYLFGIYTKVLSEPRFAAAAFALALNFGGIFIYVATAPVFLMQHLDLGETQFLWLFGPVTSGMMVGSWLSGHAAGRLTRRQTVLRAYGLMAVACAANLLIVRFLPPAVPWSVAPLFFYGMGIALAMPTITLLGLEIFTQNRGLAASCQAFLMTGTSTLVAALAMPTTSGVPARLAVGAALLLTLGACSYWYFTVSGRNTTPSDDTVR